MQTSSNFFDKNLFLHEDLHAKNTKTDKQHRHHIVQDPLRSKQQLTPWTEINPRYNFNTQRLIKFKQKINQQPRMQLIQQEVKQIKNGMISNLFNFYKNNKQKKKSTLNNVKRMNKNSINDVNMSTDVNNGWSLPSIYDKNALQQDLLQDEAKKEEKEQLQKQKKLSSKQTSTKKKTLNYIQSISISEYLHKLKQKQKVIALSAIAGKNSSQRTLDNENGFTSNRYMKKKRSKGKIIDSFNFTKQIHSKEMNYRYQSIRNPQNRSQRKRNLNISALQSIQQSFELYKKAAQAEVHQTSLQKKLNQKSQQKSFDLNKYKNSASFIGDKNLFKSNIPLSSLFLSSQLVSSKKEDQKQLQKHVSQAKKYNTISYDRSFSPLIQNQVILPKVTKNYSYHK